MLRQSSSKAFTLVELLVVVAIIGVLVTLGVPSFRRMVQKSRQAQAKIFLGSIYTLQTAFQSEWGTFGNNLAFMGFDAESKPSGIVLINEFTSRAVYSVGFPVSGLCTTENLFPDISFSWTNPSYYTNPVTMIMRPELPPTNCASPVVPFTTATSFEAAAWGVIRQDKPFTSASLTDYDQWTINENRALRNIYDGTY